MLNFLVGIKGAAWIIAGLLYFSLAGVGQFYEPSFDTRLAISLGSVLIGIICLQIWHWLECKEHTSYLQDTFADDCQADLQIHLRDSAMSDLHALVRNPDKRQQQRLH